MKQTEPQPSSGDPFVQILEGSPAEVRALAIATRQLIHRVLPQVMEVSWPRQRNTGFGTGPKKNSEHFCWIMPATAHVTLGFNYGAELPDPTGLLEGTGKLFRHVKVRAADQLNDPALIALLRVATTHRVPPVKRKGK
jgi:hypothetical protein